MSYKKNSLALLLSAAVLSLSACGGGGGGQASTGGSNGVPGVPSALAGTAAYGKPVVGAKVVAVDINGNSCGTATTASDGSYTMNTTCAPGPVEVAVVSGAPNSIPLVALALPASAGAAVSGTVNINPLTTMIVYDFLGTQTIASGLNSPSDFAHALAAVPVLELAAYQQVGTNAAFALIGSAYQTASNSVVNRLSANGAPIASGYDPVTANYVANGQGLDAFFDAYPETVTGTNNLQLGAGNSPVLSVTFSGSGTTPSALGGSAATSASGGNGGSAGSTTGSGSSSTGSGSSSTGSGSSSTGSGSTSSGPQSFVYVTNGGGNTISTYSVNAATGALTPVGSPVATGINPDSVAISPSGTFAYVANNGNLQAAGTISVYSIQPGTGALTQVGSPVATGGSNALSVRLSPNGAYAYVVNAHDSTIMAYGVNATTGALTPIGSPVATGFNPVSLAVSPDGSHVYVANEYGGTISTFSVDATTGALTPVGSQVQTGNDPFSVALSPSGALAYVANLGDGTVSAYAVDPTTGALIPIGNAIPTGEASSVAVGPSGGYVYVANDGSNSVSALSIDLSTGALTPVGNPVVTGPNAQDPFAVTVAPAGTYAYVANFGSNTVSAYSIDPSTGALTPVGNPVATGASPSAVAVDPR